jgi:glycosyltransferase involved in cell wall biosynthesis
MITSNSSAPMKFSVVVPTRERSDTLVATLKTCVSQDYGNLEIIVSDNFSQDDTREVVESFRDTRIRYINTGRRMSMSHNWEFALSHVQGDYVTFVGDDDGLLPCALRELAEIIARTGTKAVTWKWASYYWPDSIHDASRDLLIIPQACRLENRSAPKMLQEVLDFRRGYEELPFLYKGVVSTEAVNKVKTDSGGAFFHSMNPDIYSAIALALVLDDYYYSTFPYSVNGTSGHSNGAAQFNGELSGVEEAKKFNSEGNIPFHPELIQAPSHPLLVAECFLQARERLPSAGRYAVSFKKMLEATAQEARHASRWRFEQVKSAAKAIAERHNLVARAKVLFDDAPNTPGGASIGLTPGFNFVRQQLIISCKEFGVRDIYAASLLCGFLLRAKQAGLRLSVFAIARTTMSIAFGLAKRLVQRRLLLWPWNAHSKRIGNQ